MARKCLPIKMKINLWRYLTPIILAGAFLAPASAAEHATTGKPKIESFRARKSIFRDVFATDGNKVGDIVDYVIQFDKNPQLRFVLIQTGGFGNVGGKTRAIPADAFTRSDNRFHVGLSSQAFEEIPVIIGNRKKYLADPANTAALAKLCNTPVGHAELIGPYTFYTTLGKTYNVLGGGGNEMGIFEDLWINYNANQIPYLQIIPTNEDLERGRALRYNLPTSKFVRIRGGAIEFSMKVRDIIKAPMVNDVPTHVAKTGEDLLTVQSRAVQ